jgi:RND family efflux transporter MFP subunit
VRDLERTELRAPYAGRVRSESVDIGQFVNRGTPIARIYAIDYAEVRLPIPDEELAFLDLPLWRADETEVEGPEVVLRARFAGADHEWRGRVVRTEGEIDPQTRMVHVIARIKDPYAASDDGRPPLAVGLFVRAEIQGRMASNVIVVPRTALRNRDQIFLVDGEDRLRVRTADILRTDRNRAFLRGGLQPADRLVVSVLEPAVDGMRVRPVAAADPGETRRAEAVAEAARTPAVGAVPEAVE